MEGRESEQGAVGCPPQRHLATIICPWESEFNPSVMPTRWLKRVQAGIKDKSSICLAKAHLPRYHLHGNTHNSELEAAIIRATSHNEDSVDYKNVRRVFAWARTSPSSLGLVMQALSNRMEQTQSWVVALKGLMLVHGILLCSEEIPYICSLGCLPFNLSSFCDYSAKNGKSWGFTTFVRSYFNFIDRRSIFLNLYAGNHRDAPMDGEDGKLERMQELLDHLMQIRPYGDGMEVKLIIEAMNCVVIEIFDVYSSICNYIARSLAKLMKFSSPTCSKETRETAGSTGIRVLRRASTQCLQLSSYFDVCEKMGVLDASEIPQLHSISDDDIDDLELMLMDGVSEEQENDVTEQVSFTTVITREWVVFDDEIHVANNATTLPLLVP